MLVVEQEQEARLLDVHRRDRHAGIHPGLVGRAGGAFDEQPGEAIDGGLAPLCQRLGEGRVAAGAGNLAGVGEAGRGGGEPDIGADRQRAEERASAASVMRPGCARRSWTQPDLRRVTPSSPPSVFVRDWQSRTGLPTSSAMASPFERGLRRR